MNETILRQWFERHRGKYLDVIIAGRTFGGRHGESPQAPRECEFENGELLIQFSTTERLTVFAPSDFMLGKYDQLIVPCAARAVFGWHYYGRDATPENWCEEAYELDNGTVRLTRTGPLNPGTESFEYGDDRFVELL